MITLRDLVDQYVVVDIQTKNELEHFKREISPYKYFAGNNWPVQVDMNLLREYDPSYYDCDLPENTIPKPLEISMSKLMDTIKTHGHQLGAAAGHLERAMLKIYQILGEAKTDISEKEMD